MKYGSSRNNRVKRSRLATYGRAAHGVFINAELRESVAYKVLTPAARLVLIDWIGKYMQRSKGDYENLRGTGISYSFADCKENVSHKTFKTARAEIVKRGFFEQPADLQPLTPGRRRLYAPSTAWRAYQPTPGEQKRLDAAARDRRAALERWAQYRQDQETKKGRK